MISPQARAVSVLTQEHPWWPTVLVVAAYAGTTIFASAHHELWRDEVVPLSIARESSSLLDLWRMLRHEGHPILWYLCLRYAYFIFGSPSVLPVLSLLTAIVAVIVLLARAPLPLWLKALFVFGYAPLFEYSVVARGNGLSMLLLFAFCALYAGRRRRAVAIALTLAGLANTSPLGFVIAASAGVMIVIDAATSAERDPPPQRHLAAAIYVAGLAHAVVSNLPDRSVLPLQLYHHDVRTVLAALMQAIIHPAAHSASLLWIPLLSVWLWLFFALLLRRTAVLAFAALSLVGFELMFILVYPASPRHMGYVLLVVMATLWLWNPRERRDLNPRGGHAARVESWMRHLLVIPLTLTLGFQVALGAAYVVDDVQLDYSSAKRLATMIGSDARLERAIVMGEPETLTESLPYYRENPVYLLQESTFRNWLQIQIPGGRRNDCSLADLLATATDLRSRYGVPVIMALGWWLDGPAVQRAYAGTYFEQTFTVSASARSEFVARTQFLGRLRAASFTDENYDVFVLW